MSSLYLCIGCGVGASMSLLYLCVVRLSSLYVFAVPLHRLRLCLPCGKPPAFRQAHDSFGGYAARGEASTFPIVFRKAGGFPHGKRQSRKPITERGQSQNNYLAMQKRFAK